MACTSTRKTQFMTRLVSHIDTCSVRRKLLTQSSSVLRRWPRALQPRRESLLKRAFLVVVTVIVMTVAVPRLAAQRIELSIDASKPGAKIDRNLFGQFAEHLGHGIYEGIWVGPDSKIPNTRGIRNDVVAALKAIQVPNVRWPGGCFADEYHWRDGVGPQRIVSSESQLGRRDRAKHFRHSRIHGLHRPDRQRGLPLGQSRFGYSQEAAEWLEYMTAAQATTLAKERAANGHPAPYKVAWLGHRQRKLGLRWQHDARVLSGPDEESTATSSATTILRSWRRTRC